MHAKSIVILLLLVGAASAAPASEQSAQADAQVQSTQQQQQPQNAAPTQVEAVQPAVVESPVQQPVQSAVVPQAAAVQPAPEQVQPQQQQQSAVQPAAVVTQHVQHVQHAASPLPSSFYAPAGLVQVVGAQQAPAVVTATGPAASVDASPKPSRAVSYSEQYGQPENSGLPPNYKPFGSWGLYIGGNPADGYYTNYYKALSNSVDKQTGSGESASVAAGPKPSIASGTSVRQASGLSSGVSQNAVPQSSPFAGGDFYPFAYSPTELNSGVRQPAVLGSGSAAEQLGSSYPVQGGQVPGGAAVPHVYGAPGSYEHVGVSSYSDFYGSKRIGSSYVAAPVAAPSKVSQEPLKQQVLQEPVQFVSQAPVKGSPQYQYQSRVYVYSAPVGPLAAPQSAVSSPSSSQQQQQQQQVVAYPVPVGSQIVGSQQGVDGAFAPYGVHAFTRYAVKPAIVSQSDPSYYYSVPGVSTAQQAGIYRQTPQQQHQQQQSYVHVYQPIAAHQQHQQPSAHQAAQTYYGYPAVGQLHYSQGQLVPEQHVQAAGVAQQVQEAPVVEKQQSEVVIDDKQNVYVKSAQRA